jgi:hypothetical protein
MIGHVKDCIRKPAAGRDFRPAKEDRLLTLQKFAALFGGKAPQEFCCFFSSEKKQVKKAAKLRGAAFCGAGNRSCFDRVRAIFFADTRAGLATAGTGGATWPHAAEEN